MSKIAIKIKCPIGFNRCSACMLYGGMKGCNFPAFKQGLVRDVTKSTPITQDQLFGIVFTEVIR